MALVTGATSLLAVVFAFEIFAGSDTRFHLHSIAGEQKGGPETERQVVVIASNSGKRSSKVIGAELLSFSSTPESATWWAPRPDLKPELRLPLILVRPPVDQAVVEPGPSRTFTFELPVVTPETLGVKSRKDPVFTALLRKTHRLKVTYAEYDEEEKPVVLERATQAALVGLLCRSVEADKPGETDNQVCELEVAAARARDAGEEEEGS